MGGERCLSDAFADFPTHSKPHPESHVGSNTKPVSIPLRPSNHSSTNHCNADNRDGVMRRMCLHWHAECPDNIGL